MDPKRKKNDDIIGDGDIEAQSTERIPRPGVWVDHFLSAHASGLPHHDRERRPNDIQE